MCEAPIFTEVLSFSADTQHPLPRHTDLSIPLLVPFLGWTPWILPLQPCVSLLYALFSVLPAWNSSYVGAVSPLQWVQPQVVMPPSKIFPASFYLR